MSILLYKYGVVHKVVTAYHPQTNSQAEVFNREIKKTLQKMTNPSRKDWSRLLEDSLWAHRTVYWTSLRMSPYRIIFGKLRSRWDGPFVITNVLPYGAVELKDEHTNNTFQLITSQSRKTMINLNFRGHRSFGIVLGVGHAQVWGRQPRT
ncbi:hypothetical protein CR513_03086, partial [Mucuna pruriens]